jgi:hypothetical protein
MNTHPNVAKPDLVTASIYLECMEEQKERLRALLWAIRVSVEDSDDDTVKALVRLAETTTADHANWYALRDALGIPEGGQ